MQNPLSLQSDMDDPYAVYAQRVVENPVVYDPSNELWTIYLYEACRTVLTSPESNSTKRDECGYVGHLVRPRFDGVTQVE